MKHHKPDQGQLSAEFEAASPKRLIIDLERYQSYLDHSGMSEVEKKEFLEALWSIIMNFVDLGFGVHPLQEVTEKSPESDDFIALLGGDDVGSGSAHEQPEKKPAQGSGTSPDSGLEVP